MSVDPDFGDLFAALNAAGARYLLVGGHAIAFHAQPRFTKDLDVWMAPDPAKAARVYDLLHNKRASSRPQDLLELEILENG